VRRRLAPGTCGRNVCLLYMASQTGAFLKVFDFTGVNRRLRVVGHVGCWLDVRGGKSIEYDWGFVSRGRVAESRC